MKNTNATASGKISTGLSFYWFLWSLFLCVSVIILLSFNRQESKVMLPQEVWLTGITLMLLSSGYFLFLCLSVMFRKDWQTVFTGPGLPHCSIIVPAYNEGEHVYWTIKKLLEIDYPEDKYDIIAVNDGSVDDTLLWLNRAKQLSPEKIRIIDCLSNCGKKHALHTGIKQAAGEFIITVDSDTLVRNDAVSKLIQPFADPRVGAVAGTITGRKDEKNFHSLMLDVMLVFGCEFLRKAQSVCGNVFCTPGALSAYRKSAVLPLIDIWLEQRFLGAPATIGEDRAIATLLLDSGFLVVHQPEAEAETCLPDNYRGVCKMLLRWTRSDVRENLIMSKTVFRMLKSTNIRSIDLFLHWLFLCVNMMLPFVFLPLVILVFAMTEHLMPALAILFISSAVWSLIPGMIYCAKKRSLKVIINALWFGVYTMTALSWISIYSVFTVRNSRWLTREKKPCITPETTH